MRVILWYGHIHFHFRFLFKNLWSCFTQKRIYNITSLNSPVTARGRGILSVWITRRKEMRLVVSWQNGIIALTRTDIQKHFYQWRDHCFSYLCHIHVIFMMSFPCLNIERKLNIWRNLTEFVSKKLLLVTQKFHVNFHHSSFFHGSDGTP